MPFFKVEHAGQPSPSPCPKNASAHKRPCSSCLISYKIITSKFIFIFFNVYGAYPKPFLWFSGVFALVETKHLMCLALLKHSFICLLKITMTIEFIENYCCFTELQIYELLAFAFNHIISNDIYSYVLVLQ